MHLCTWVNEEGDDGEDPCPETSSLLCLSGFVTRTDVPVYILT